MTMWCLMLVCNVGSGWFQLGTARPPQPVARPRRPCEDGCRESYRCSYRSVEPGVHVGCTRRRLGWDGQGIRTATTPSQLLVWWCFIQWPRLICLSTWCMITAFLVLCMMMQKMWAVAHCESKSCRCTLAPNFTKCWPIFKTLSLSDSFINF